MAYEEIGGRQDYAAYCVSLYRTAAARAMYGEDGRVYRRQSLLLSEGEHRVSAPREYAREEGHVSEIQCYDRIPVQIPIYQFPALRVAAISASRKRRNPQYQDDRSVSDPARAPVGSRSTVDCR